VTAAKISRGVEASIETTPGMIRSAMVACGGQESESRRSSESEIEAAVWCHHSKPTNELAPQTK
jgi:hypothetical protein